MSEWFAQARATAASVSLSGLASKVTSYTQDVIAAATQDDDYNNVLDSHPANDAHSALLRSELDRVREEFKKLQEHSLSLELRLKQYTNPSPSSSPRISQSTVQDDKLVNEKLARAVAHLKRLTDENTKLSSRIGDLENENADLKKQCKGLIEQKDQIQLGGNADEFIKREKELISEVEENNAIILQLEKKIGEMERAEKDKEIVYVKRVEELQSQIDKLTELSTENQKQAERKEEEYQNTISSLQTQLNTVPQIDKNELDHLATISALQNQLNSLTATSSAKESENMKSISTLQSQIATLTAKLETQQQQNLESHVNDTISTLQTQLTSLTTASSKKDEEHLITISTMQSQIKTLSSQLETLQQQLELQEKNQDTEVSSQLQSLSRCIITKTPYIRVTESKLSDALCLLAETVTDHISSLESQLQSEINELRGNLQTVNSERTMLLDRIKHMKDTVGPKLQQELEESNRLREQITSLTAINTDLTSQLTNLQNSQTSQTSLISRLRSELDSQSETFSLKLNELTNVVEKKTKMVESLQAHLLEIEETSETDLVKLQNELKVCKSELDRTQKEKEEWNSIAEAEKTEREEIVKECDELREELDELRSAIGEKEIMIKELEKAVRNLQGVLEEFEKSREAEVEFSVEGYRMQVESERSKAEEYKKLVESLEEKLSKVDINAPDSKLLQKEVAEKSELMGKYKRDVIQLQSHLAEAMRRIRELSQTEDNVDRRIISNLIISFCAAPRGDRTRFEILQVIASVLKFNDEEKFKVGLIRKPWSVMSPTPSHAQVPPSGESFADLWISFLLKETSDSSSKEKEGFESPKMSLGSIRTSVGVGVERRSSFLDRMLRGTGSASGGSVGDGGSVNGDG